MTPSIKEPEVQPARIAVVVVTRGKFGALQRCLQALAASPSVIVVDNGDRDSEGLDEEFLQVRFIRLPRDFGLTKALNIGIRAANAELVLLLSPEVEIIPEAIESLAATLDREPSVGAVCPLLMTPDGAVALQVSDLPTSSVPDPAPRPGRPGEHAPCVTGRAILFRSFFLRALRHIDERYGDYGSSIELCQQLRRANKALLIHPDVTAVVRETPIVRSTAREADRELGISRFLGKHRGMVKGYAYLAGRILAALVSFRFGKLIALVSFRKIDGA